jgi:hypothetical protein
MDEKDHKLEELEERLIQEEKERTTKKEMLVSGRSVFEIKRLKDKDLTKKEK